jgi:hypothetical protein
MAPASLISGNGFNDLKSSAASFARDFASHETIQKIKQARFSKKIT